MASKATNACNVLAFKINFKNQIYIYQKTFNISKEIFIKEAFYSSIFLHQSITLDSEPYQNSPNIPP